MFRVAQFVVRHKVGAVAVIALGVFIMTPNKGEEAAAQRSNSPWSAQAAAAPASSSEDAGFVTQMVDGAVAYLDENDMNPLDQADEAVGRLDNTAAAYGAVNAANGR